MSDSKNKISVIIPVYNTEKYVREAVESIVHQTYKNVEIILVDDGSSDESGKVCDLLQRAYENVYAFHQKNSGPSVARNLGMDHATGDYITFLDSDDYLSPETYQAMMDFMLRENADIGSFGGDYVYRNKVTCHVDNTQKEKRQVWDRKDAIQALIEPGPFFVSACDKIIRRELCDGIRFPTGVTFEDYRFTIQLLMKVNKVVFDISPFYHYRQRKSSTCHNKRVSYEAVNAVSELVDFVKLNYPDLYPKALLFYCSELISMDYQFENYPGRRDSDAHLAAQKQMIDFVHDHYSILCEGNNSSKFSVVLALLRYCPSLYHPIRHMYQCIRSGRGEQTTQLFD